MEFRERRKVSRRKGMIPVEMKGGTGMTRDFSSSGIFFETDQCLSPGMPLEFALRLEKSYPDGPPRVQCKGTVVRVELNKTGKMGVAVTIDSYIFESPDGPGSAGFQ